MAGLRTVAIVKTDIRGFTDRTSRLSTSDLDLLLRKHRAELLEVVQQFKGTPIKEIGDSLLATFASSTQAVLASIEMQRTIARKVQPEEAPLEIRIAVSAGDVLVQNDDIFGMPVNLVARLEAITPAGQVYFTESVFQNINRAEFASEPVGSFNFEGIADPVRVHRTVFRHRSREIDGAVLVTDMSGFNAFAETVPLEHVETVLYAWEDAHRISAENNCGTVRQVIADSQIITFESVAQALLGWRELHARLKEFNQSQTISFQIQFCAGLDKGPMRIFRTAMYGAAENRAGALSNACPIGGLLIANSTLGGIPQALLESFDLKDGNQYVSENPRVKQLLPISVLFPK